MKLQTKLLALYTLSTIVILLALGSFFYSRLWDERLRSIQVDVSNELQHVDFVLNAFFAEVESDVNALVANETVRSRDDRNFTSFLNADEKSYTYHIGKQEQEIIDILNNYRMTHRYVNSVYMGRENGSFVRSHKRARPLAVKKGLELTYAISPEIETIMGDERRLEQILLNLIGNAIKFTEKGSIKIECESEGDNVTIRVIDTGTGIKAEDMETVFQAFRQIDSGLTRKYEGTGLGLSISKKLVELMGGQIRVTSVWGSGSAFSFSLPKAGKEA